MRWILGLVIAALAVTLTASAQSSSGHRFAPPPANCVVQKSSGGIVVVGEVYLSAHADTALLKPAGFRRFKFLGWSLGRAHYAAVWPLEVDLEALPSAVDEVAYRTAEPQEETASQFEVHFQSMDEPAERKAATRARHKSHDLEEFFDGADEIVRANTARHGHLSTYQDYERQNVFTRYVYLGRDNWRGRSTVANGHPYYYDNGPQNSYGAYPHVGGFEPGDYQQSRGSSCYDSDPAPRSACSPGGFFATSQSHTTLRATPIQTQYGGQLSSGWSSGDGALRDYWSGTSSGSGGPRYHMTPYQQLYGGR